MKSLFQSQNFFFEADESMVYELKYFLFFLFFVIAIEFRKFSLHLLIFLGDYNWT